MSDRQVINAYMSSLIDKLGGFDAACAVIEARWGEPVSKGTLSKKRAMQLAWSIEDMIALEAAAGSYALRRWLARDLPEVESAVCLTAGAAEVAREFSEGIGAVGALLVNPADPKRRAVARKELRDLAESAQRFSEGLE